MRSVHRFSTSRIQSGRAFQAFQVECEQLCWQQYVSVDRSEAETRDGFRYRRDRRDEVIDEVIDELIDELIDEVIDEVIDGRITG